MLKQLVRNFGARKRRGQARYEYVPEGWQRAVRDWRVKGWDVDAVPRAQGRWLTQLRSNLAGTAPLGVRSKDTAFTPTDAAEHNTAVSFAYVVTLTALSAATEGRRRISLLDWGGGVGQYALIARAVAPQVAIAYHCKEVAVQCEAGRRELPDATFYASDDEFCCQKFDLVLASGALHYAQNWREVLARLATATERYLFVTRQPTVLEAESFVVLQRAYEYGYNTEYLGWCLNRTDFLAAASEFGLKLVREFVVAEWADIPGAPEACHDRGYLFRPTLHPPSSSLPPQPA
jgi:putative methyltransferase (TIGR04325 family)